MSVPEETPYDLVVVGGGITGAAIARDAALRGLRVALFEKGDYGSGTSSKSSKLVHGGLRYLEQAEIGLVFESVSERRVQMQNAPHLVRPLSFMLPVYEDSRVGLERLNVGLWLYDTLAMFRSPKIHKTIRGAQKVCELEPGIRMERLCGAIEYSDCFTDDARLVLENILAAKEAGARCESYTEVVSLQRHNGLVESVRVRDVLSGTERTVATACVIVATGPWSDATAQALGADLTTPLLRPTKGVHLVFSHERLPLRRAVTMMSHLDGRVMFAIPWRGRTVIGTTDTDFDGDPDCVHANAEDVDYLCNSANYLFPNAHLGPQDVLSTWAGLRPLINEDAESASEVSREHQVYVREDGLLLIAGGKLTTYRLMAKDAVKAAVRWLRDNRDAIMAERELTRPRTKKRPLPGGVGLRDQGDRAVSDLARRFANEHNLPQELAEHWAFGYGTRANALLSLVRDDPTLKEPLQSDLPHTWAEIVLALQQEDVRTLDDVLSRRVPLLLLGLEQGLDIVDSVADRMARYFGWCEARRTQEIQRYKQTVADSRRFRQAPL